MCRERTELVIFLGTPHRGSSYAGWGVIASNLVRLGFQDSNKKVVDTLDVNSEVLDNIHEEFKSLVAASSVKIHSFQETRGISGMKGLDEKVNQHTLFLFRLRSDEQPIDLQCRWSTTFPPSLTWHAK